MSDPSWNRVKEVFQAALDREPVERATFVQQACGDDRVLQAEVESLLAALHRAGSFAEHPAIESLTLPRLLDTRPTPAAGRRALQRGDALGPHQILEFVGAGGMGEVYRAHDERLGRNVAIKVLPDDNAADSTARRQLLSEARAAATLNHPNVCTVHEVGEVDGRVFIVMEFIEGRSLDHSIPPGGMQTDEAVRYGLQIADAVAHAHARGIVHADLKSSNVMVAPSGLVKVLDFGLAISLNAKNLSTMAVSDDPMEAGGLRGTLPYMAPELLRGERADTASDVWALGIILYELAIGRRPFSGATSSKIVSAIVHDNPARFPPRRSWQLSSVIERCLQKRPRHRYTHARDVSAALNALVTGAPVSTADSGAKSTWRRIAVLPLQNMGDTGQQPLVDGFHEALITDLAGLRALRVVARSSVMRFRNRAVSIPRYRRAAQSRHGPHWVGRTGW